MRNNALVPYDYYGGTDIVPVEEPLGGLQNSFLAQISPETVLRLRGALWRGAALISMRPSAEHLASAAADGVRVRVTQSRQRVSAGFKIETGNGACGGHRVWMRGEVWVDGV